MSTGIEWTDATWNPVTGCDKVSPGCAHCYAETVAARFWKGRAFTDVQCHEDRLDQPLRWTKPRRVFVNSMSDLFHEAVSDDFISRVFAVMALAPQHTFQILTKRAARMQQYLKEMSTNPDAYCFAWANEYERADLGETPSLTRECWPLPNVWIGVSVENQHFADERIPLLLQTPAAVRFISAEPLLGGVDLSGFIPKLQPWKPYVECRHGYDACPMCDSHPKPALDWVIVGGESGPEARPFDVAWARSLLAQCEAAAVPVFVKQLGANVRATGQCDPADIHLRDRKGGDMAEWPADLRVREFPRSTT